MFQNVEFNGLSKLSLILRVGGSLGEFAPEPNDGQPLAEAGVLVCNVVVRNHEWEKRSEIEIKAIVASHLKPAVAKCCHYLNLGTEFADQVLGVLAQHAVQPEVPASGRSSV